LNRISNIIFWNLLFPLLAGGAVYGLFRKNTLISSLLQHFFKVTPIAVKEIRLSWLINVLPDFCWCYSFSFALLLVLKPKTVFNQSTIGVFSVLVFSEVLQLGLPEYFTFDPVDLAAALLAFVLSLFVYRKFL